MATRLETSPTAAPARVHDCWLGGKDNFEPDRNAADTMAAVAPWIPKGARASRAFLRRAVIHLTQLGIDQILDIGCGLPHDPNVHQIAQAWNSKARTVYVDNDPMVMAHARARLATDDRTIAIQADARAPEEMINQLVTSRLPHLDFARPVAVLMVGLLEHLTDDDAVNVVRVARQVCAPGSCLAIAHLTADAASFDRHWKARSAAEPEAWRHGTIAAAEIHQAMVGPLNLRTREQTSALFHGFDLLRPGLLPADRWRAPGLRGPEPVPVLAGVGRLPTPD